MELGGSPVVVTGVAGAGTSTAGRSSLGNSVRRTPAETTCTRPSTWSRLRTRHPIDDEDRRLGRLSDQTYPGPKENR